MPGLEASSGANKIVENIARLPPDLFAQTCQRILTYLQGRSRGVDSAEISDSFQKAGIRLDQDALQEVVRFLLLTFRSAGRSGLSGEELVSRLERGSGLSGEGLGSTHGEEGSGRWPRPALQVLQRLWSEQGALVRSQQEAQAVLSIGQLVDVQWKLGMAVSSDTCRSLHSPYVCLLMKMADASGLVSHKSFEMTVPQFQNLHRQFKEMAAVVETV